MTNEELRMKLIANIDKTLDVPWPLKRLIDGEALRLLKALRSFCQSADDKTLSQINAYLAREPVVADPQS